MNTEENKNPNIEEQTPEQTEQDFKFLGAQTEPVKKAKTEKSMLNRFKPIIALCCVAVLLFTTFVVLRHALPSDTTEGEKEESTIELLDFNGTSAERLDITNDLGSYSFVRKLEKTYCLEGKEDLPINNSRVLTALTYLGELSAQAVVDENPTDLEQYGLATPVSTVVWTRGEQKHTVYFGTQAPSGYYYMMVDGDKTVYTYESTAASYFLSPRMDYYDTLVYNFDIDGDAPYVNRFSLGKKGEDTIEVHYRDIEEDELISSYHIVEPIAHDFSSTKASYIMAFITDLVECTVYDDDLSEQNLEKYGLTDPEYTFYFRNVAEEHTLYFGNLSDEGYRYMYSPQNDFIYIVDEELISPITLTIADYCEEISYSRSYDTVDNIVITGGGKTYTCVISGNAEEESLKAYINGKYVEYENFANLYAHIISIGIKGVGDKDADDEHIVTVTFNCLDGTQDVLKYYKKDELECFYELNGEGALVVSTSHVEQILEFAQKLYEGEEIILDW